MSTRQSPLSSRLRFARELTSDKFSDVGLLYGAKEDMRAGKIALFSDSRAMSWRARQLPRHRGQQRLSLYSSSIGERIGVCDSILHTIHDVAFHRSGPWLAIATGDYDGGYFFDGELLLWNWQSGECRSLLNDSRYVARCRFADNDDGIVALLRPRCEDDEDVNDPNDTFFALTLPDVCSGMDERATGSTALDPRILRTDPLDAGFAHPGHSIECRGVSEAIRTALDRAGYQSRYGVWDLLWLDERHLAVASSSCVAEVWDLASGTSRRHVASGQGVQLLKNGDRECLVHVCERGDPFTGRPDKSKLLTLTAGDLITRREFDRALVFAVAADGTLLGRDVSFRVQKKARADLLIDVTGHEVVSADLGHYDLFNHYIRIDGAKENYFLRATPPDGHQGKVLCSIDRGGVVAERLRWDDGTVHRMDGIAVMAADGTLVRATREYHPQHPENHCVLEAFEPITFEPIWTCQYRLDVVALAVSEAAHVVVVASLEGTISVHDIDGGSLLDRCDVMIAGVSSVVTALAIHGSAVAAGTADGRVLLYELV